MQANTPRRTTRSAAQSQMMETLEQRRLMSVSLLNGVLTVRGTNLIDRMEVDQSGSDIYVFENFVLSRVVPAASVNKIVMYGLDGNDYMKIWSGVLKPAEMHGEGGNDTMIGGILDDHMHGGPGNDHMDGSYGNDSMWGADGNDTMIGFAGRDWLHAGFGADSVSAGAGNDTIFGDDGNDTLYGEADNDLIYGQIGDDFIGGSTGNDTIYGGWGNDKLYGEGGNDSLLGEDGNDTIHGGLGNDRMFGGNGNDFFQAFDDWTDYIDGGAGYDTAHCDKRPWYAPWQTKDDLVSIESSYE